MRWDPPGPGTWWLELEHFPRPVSGLFADLFPPVTIGWSRGAARYGDTQGPSRWATVNAWLYYGSPDPVPPDPALDGVRERARAEMWWRDEVVRWHEEERPAIVAANLALQSEDLAALDAAGLADHLHRAFSQYLTVGPLHFEHAGRRVCNDVLKTEAAAAGFPDLDVGALSVGSSPATARPARLVAAITDVLDVPSVASLDEVRAASTEAAQRLDEYLEEYGWRLVESYDPAFPALIERPAMIVNAINACLSQRWRREDAKPVAAPWRARDRAPVPDEVAARLDALLDDARALHALRDDDDGVCFFWTMGLVRRAVLEAGRRLQAEGRLVAVTDLFEASSTEILDLMGREAASPSAEELSARAQARAEAGSVVPPPSLGGDTSGERLVAAPPRPALTGTPVGTGVGRGRARVHRSGDDALACIEPGDVLVAVTTTPAFNTVFPLLAGVVCELGGLGSHVALLSRELGVPAVVGVDGAMAAIPDGAMVEVDGDTGVCTLL